MTRLLFVLIGVGLARPAVSQADLRQITRYADPVTRQVVREVYSARVTATDTIRQGPSRLLYRSGKVEAEGFYTDGKPDSTLTEFYENGRKRLEVRWVKGLKEGPFTAWDSYGVPMQQGTFLHNEQTGPFKTFYPDGRLKTEADFVNGFPQGLVKAYDPEGRLVSDVTYQNHLPNGPTRTYWPNGQVKSEKRLRNGQPDGPEKTWFDNGQVASENLPAPNGKSGIQRAYYPSGQRQREGAYKVVALPSEAGAGAVADPTGKVRRRETRNETGARPASATATTAALDGPVTEYFEDGTIAGRSTYKLGVKVGTEELFYAGGKVKERTTYRNDGRDFDRIGYYPSGNPAREEHVADGLKTGDWPIYYDAPNQPVQELARYVRNRLSGEQLTYHPNGQVASRGTREGGRRVGIWTEYDADGHSSAETTWKNGAKNGPYRELQATGKPRLTGAYANNLQSGLWTWYDESTGKPTRTATFRRGVELDPKAAPAKKGR